MSAPRPAASTPRAHDRPAPRVVALLCIPHGVPPGDRRVLAAELAPVPIVLTGAAVLSVSVAVLARVPSRRRG